LGKFHFEFPPSITKLFHEAFVKIDV